MNPVQTIPFQSAIAQQQIPVPQIQTLQIKERQAQHFHRVMDILSRFYFYVDGSEMRTGKTYIAAAVALTLQLPTIVICPLMARKVWSDVFTTYGVPTYQLPGTGGIMTYDAFRSKKGYQPKHDLLVRDDSGDGTKFYPTARLARILNAGALVIFDECQKLKNTSDQHKAVKALMRQFYAMGGTSRAAFLSGTAMDKSDHVVNFLKMIGFITRRNLYSKINGEVQQEGIQDLHQWGSRINPDATSEFIATHPFEANRRSATNYVFDFFEKIIKPGVISIMPGLNIEKNIKNGYYVLQPEDEREYRSGISDLAGAVRYNPKSGTVLMTKESMGSVTLAQVRIQKAKMGAMARVAREILTKPHYSSDGRPVYYKVILAADYEDVWNGLEEKLAEFNPLKLVGKSLTEKKRNENIDFFREPNLNHRVLIANPSVGALGIALHIEDEAFPCMVLMMPGYRVSQTHQFTYRIYGNEDIEYLAPQEIRLFFGLCGAKENSILSACARKGEILQRIHREQGARFPNEYENEYEEEPQNGDLVVSEPVENQRENETMIETALERMERIRFTE
jgi:hypothetical protein